MIMANFRVFLLLFLLVVAASAKVFVSIDCGGASNVYRDENGIKWSGDHPFIQTGENAVVQKPNSLSHVMNSLRIFSTHSKKNCYSINATNGDKVHVRARFYYGNYDLKSSPPSFDLQFNGHKWATVETSTEHETSYEITDVLMEDAMSVCLIQSQPNQIPFMSALEVRSLASKHALFSTKTSTYVPRPNYASPRPYYVPPYDPYAYFPHYYPYFYAPPLTAGVGGTQPSSYSASGNQPSGFVYKISVPAIAVFIFVVIAVLIILHRRRTRKIAAINAACAQPPPMSPRYS